LGDEAIIDAVSTISFFPVLVLAARICPRGVEGTLYALLMSVLNFGNVISNEIGSILTHSLHITSTDFTNLWKLILICSCSALLPLPLLWILRVPNTDSDTIQGQQRMQHLQNSTDSDFDPSIVDQRAEPIGHTTVNFETPIIPSRCILPCKDTPRRTRRSSSERNCCSTTGRNHNYEEINQEETDENSSLSSEERKKQKGRKFSQTTHGSLSDEETLRNCPSPTFPTVPIDTTVTTDLEEETINSNLTTTSSNSPDELHLHLELPSQRDVDLES